MKTTHSHAFSLIELLITIAILSLVIAIMVPRFSKLSRGAYIRVAQDQAQVLQQAVNSWVVMGGHGGLVNRPVAQTMARFSDVTNTTDMSRLSFYSTADPVIMYLDSSFIKLSDGTDNLQFNDTATPYLSTDAMRKITGTTFSNVNVQIGNQTISVPPITGVTHAHMRIYWPDDMSVRSQSAPAVALFIPSN